MVKKTKNLEDDIPSDEEYEETPLRTLMEEEDAVSENFEQTMHVHHTPRSLAKGRKSVTHASINMDTN